ncbi:glycosyltransferase family 92 protein F13G3.3-like [Gigantopelta aegis]|uniref:glycosyltransferase family 92 protein F13G3.3-like n=1 Tax=Gigantopelta aegis TaxID=1735272 RepID=UPI001B8890DF|nr:glycosyltransferase family 92 protein F13G3.3-like [Gigantopelta aegis]
MVRIAPWRHSVKRICASGCIAVVIYFLYIYVYRGYSATTHTDFDYELESQRLGVHVSPVSSDGCDFSSKWRRNPTVANLSLTSQVWVRSDTAADIFVYSAYYDVDDDNVPVIRVIGIGPRTGTHHVICLVQWSADSTCLEDRPATVEIMPEHNSKRYSALFLICDVSVLSDRKPYAVSITKENSTSLKNRLLVKYPEPLRFNITVCFSCIHSKYNDERETIQTIEMDQILGAEHFVAYDFSIGGKVENVFMYYSNQGIVDINVWNLPRVQIHYFGQLAAINDCVYSNRGRSKYIIVKDLDEILVPYKDKTLPTLINRMMTENPEVAAILFKNSYFNKRWPDDTKGFQDGRRAKRFELYMLLKVWRENFIWPRNRMKSIILPSRIHTCGIHAPQKVRNGFKRIKVKPTEGLLQHYKKLPTEQTRKGRIKEDFLRLYSKQLIYKFKRTFSIIHSNDVVSDT